MLRLSSSRPLGPSGADSPAPVVHPEPEKLQRRLEGRFVRYPHGHVEVVDEEHELLPSERAELVLRALFHGLLHGCLGHHTER